MNAVAELYEAHPYPHRTLGEDQKRVHQLSPLENLHVVNHHAWGGARDLTEPLRILVAGGGTGDAVVMLGWQLKQLGNPGEVVYIDLSKASRAVAEQRASDMGIENVTFHTGSLLEIEHLGTFDYINCSGVLHHLPSPDAGMRSLSAQLADQGCIGAMVYGQYGRTGIYPAQAMLRMLGEGLTLGERLPLARHILGTLPPSNWLKKNVGAGYNDNLTDAEVVDRFLHPCDRAYTVPELVELTEQAGLSIASLTPALAYEPGLYRQDAVLEERLEGMSPLARAAVGELLGGVIGRHNWFSVGPDNPAPPTLNPGAIPRLLLGSGPAVAQSIARTNRISISMANLTIEQPVTPHPTTLAVLSAVDGTRTLGDIHRLAAPDAPWESFVELFDALYTLYHGAGVMVLTQAS